MVEFRKAFDPSKRYRQHTGEGSRVQQHLRDETDINRIMAKYQKTNVFEHVNRYAGQYGDFSEVPSYQEALHKVRESEEMFMSLPSNIRDRFGNDPARFITFASDASNLDEMRSMGLAPKLPPPPEPQLVKVVEGASDGGKPDDKKPKA